jgi:hypothetical protein
LIRTFTYLKLCNFVSRKQRVFILWKNNIIMPKWIPAIRKPITVLEKEATPIPEFRTRSRGRRVRGKRRFSAEHVQRITINGRLILGRKFIESTFARYFTGTVKFHGLRNERLAVIKVFNPDKIGAHFIRKTKKIVALLQASKAAHPLIEHFQVTLGNKKYFALVSEAKVTREKGGKKKTKTTLTKDPSFMSKLELHKSSHDVSIFRQALVQIAHLANAGLQVEVKNRHTGRPYTSVFEAIETAKGPKVIIQGTANLKLVDDPKKCWEGSVHALLRLVCYKRPKMQARAREIASAIERRYGFAK